MRVMSIMALLLLASCGTTERAGMAAQDRWIGRSTDEFFTKNGAPKRQVALSTGGKVYSWESVAMPAGTRTQIVCSADIVADPRGVIREVRLLEDTIGHWNLSRCSELFEQ